ncbi:MAG: hypothetical protein ACR2L2_14760, partial [Acidobacteriota bacterium]
GGAASLPPHAIKSKMPKRKFPSNKLLRIERIIYIGAWVSVPAECPRHDRSTAIVAQPAVLHRSSSHWPLATGHCGD